MRFNATVAIHKEDDWYVAKCLENSVASQGKSMDEALENLKEALELYLDGGANFAPRKTFITNMEIAV